jgi:hypothetical protein
VPVTLPLVSLITAVAVLLALLGGAATLARRRLGLVHLVGAALLELLLLVQAGMAVAAMAGGDRPADTATFVSYLVGVLLVPPAGVLWARSDPSRWAGTILAVAGSVVAVMGWRLLQLWEATGG